jgi:tRNA (cytidine/uridine-2'-O-)-methyltransferase
LLLGSESAGVPEHVHNSVEVRVTVPMRVGQRSLNLATAAAMVLGEALRQLDAFPKGDQ